MPPVVPECVTIPCTWIAAAPTSITSSEENNARYEALQERREALQLREEANAEHLSAVLAKLGDLLDGIERKFGES